MHRAAERGSCYYRKQVEYQNCPHCQRLERESLCSLLCTCVPQNPPVPLFLFCFLLRSNLGLTVLRCLYNNMARTSSSSVGVPKVSSMKARRVNEAPSPSVPAPRSAVCMLASERPEMEAKRGPLHAWGGRSALNTRPVCPESDTHEYYYTHIIVYHAVTVWDTSSYKKGAHLC